jgi:hypothetical protein
MNINVPVEAVENAGLQPGNIVHDVECIRPHITLRPSRVCAGETAVTYPRLHKASFVVEYLPVIL